MNTLILVIVLVQMYRTRNKRNGRDKMGKVTEARDTAKYALLVYNYAFINTIIILNYLLITMNMTQ